MTNSQFLIKIGYFDTGREFQYLGLWQSKVNWPRLINFYAMMV